MLRETGNLLSVSDDSKPSIAIPSNGTRLVGFKGVRMRVSSWTLFVAVFVAAVPAAASSSSQTPVGPWRLFQLFEPVPGPQRGVDVWALEADLHVAAKLGRNPAV